MWGSFILKMPNCITKEVTPIAGAAVKKLFEWQMKLF